MSFELAFAGEDLSSVMDAAAAAAVASELAMRWGDGCCLAEHPVVNMISIILL